MISVCFLNVVLLFSGASLLAGTRNKGGVNGFGLIRIYSKAWVIHNSGYLLDGLPISLGING